MENVFVVRVFVYCMLSKGKLIRSVQLVSLRFIHEKRSFAIKCVNSSFTSRLFIGCTLSSIKYAFGETTARTINFAVRSISCDDKTHRR